MPVGKYYCDYCDKQFQDTVFARKRHLQGVQHQRAKALWFNNSLIRDQNQIHRDSFAKGVCNRFISTGSCPYGDACIYLHPKQNFQGNNTPSTVGNIIGDSSGISLGNLPPSLQPPPEGGYPSLPFVDWG